MSVWIFLLLIVVDETTQFDIVGVCHDISQHDGTQNNPPCLKKQMFSQDTVGAKHRRYIRSLPRDAHRGPKSKPVQLVIANCNENHIWIPKEFPLIIYEKCTFRCLVERVKIRLTHVPT